MCTSWPLNYSLSAVRRRILLAHMYDIWSAQESENLIDFLFVSMSCDCAKRGTKFKKYTECLRHAAWGLKYLKEQNQSFLLVLTNFLRWILQQTYRVLHDEILQFIYEEPFNVCCYKFGFGDFRLFLSKILLKWRHVRLSRKLTSTRLF